MAVLCDSFIEAVAKRGCIRPFRPEQLQPASYDLRLGTTFRVLANHIEEIDPTDKETLATLTTRVEKAPGERVIVHSGEFLLACTEEHVRIPTDMVGRLEGKSTLGRCGLAIHITAGYLDPGFHGVITLEVANMASRPIVLRPGMLIAQLGFLQMNHVARQPYNGRYQNDQEATPAK